MRKRIWITCLVLLAVCLVLLLSKTPHNQQTALPEQSDAPSNQPQGQPDQPKVEGTPQTTSIQNVGKVFPRPSEAELAENRQLRELADWQRPIDFYGKVVDENSNAVADVSVTFGWSEFPTQEGSRRATTRSDAEGLFLLQGKHGPSLDIWVSKEGYYASHGGQKGFSYYHGDFSPDPQNPVIFNLQKKAKVNLWSKEVFHPAWVRLLNFGMMERQWKLIC